MSSGAAKESVRSWGAPRTPCWSSTREHESQDRGAAGRGRLLPRPSRAPTSEAVPMGARHQPPAAGTRTTARARTTAPPRRAPTHQVLTRAAGFVWAVGAVGHQAAYLGRVGRRRPTPRGSSEHSKRVASVDNRRLVRHARDRRAASTPSRIERPAGRDGDRRISAYLSLGASFLNGTPCTPRCTTVTS